MEKRKQYEKINKDEVNSMIINQSLYNKYHTSSVAFDTCSQDHALLYNALLGSSHMHELISLLRLQFIILQYKQLSWLFSFFLYYLSLYHS